MFFARCRECGWRSRNYKEETLAIVWGQDHVWYPDDPSIPEHNFEVHYAAPKRKRVIPPTN